MNETLHGDLSVIGMKGTEDFTRQVDSYLRLWRSKGGASANADNNGFIIWPDSIRFGTGEAKCIIHESMRSQTPISLSCFKIKYLFCLSV